LVRGKGENAAGAVKDQGLEGIVAKRKDSLYEARQRTGAWKFARLRDDKDARSVVKEQLARGFDGAMNKKQGRISR
jgi:hypothetical protein